VRLPLSDSVDKLGESYDTARAKFLALEQRLLKQPPLHQDYSAFLEEYVQLGHMTPLGEAEEKKKVPHFYMPHNNNKNSVALVRERTIPTERPPPVGEVSANFCG